MVLWALAHACGEFATAQDIPSSYREDRLDEAHRRRLADDRYWHLLVHYRSRWFGGVESEADGTAFFLSPDGKFRPEAELDATIAAFFSEVSADPDEQHAQCRFPARFAWVREQLALDLARLPKPSCERFLTWRSRISPASATLIFADAYLANPPSMYGHTFLRLNHETHDRSERLLDYTINYSADTATRNGIVFAIRGLMGGYPGRFSTTPYYIKVQEYTNLESRDLWEYRLSLTPEQLDRLVMHLWELGSTYFDYYFLTQNCSFQLLPLIEIADPTLHLTGSLRPWVIPIDTVRVLLDQPGLVTGVERRPSHMNRMLEKRAGLSWDEMEVAERASTRMDDQVVRRLEAFSTARQAVVLDAAYDYFRYREGFTRGQSSESKRLERRMLLARNQLRVETTESSATRDGVPPHRGHRSGRAGMQFGVTRDSTFQELAIRPAFHDLIGEQKGYLPNSQLEMFHLRVRYDNEDREPYVEELALLTIFSLSPRDQWIRKPSWRIWSGLDLAKELACAPRSCLYYGFVAGRGVSAATQVVGTEVFYALAEGNIGLGGVFRDRYRVGAGARLGVLMTPTPRWRLRVEGAFTRYPLGDIHSNTDVLVEHGISLMDDVELRMAFQQESSYREGTLGVVVYF